MNDYFCQICRDTGQIEIMGPDMVVDDYIDCCYCGDLGPHEEPKDRLMKWIRNDLLYGIKPPV